MKHTKRRFAAILLGIGMMFSSAASLHAQSQWLDKVTLYFPNRVLDLLDSFTLNIGVPFHAASLARYDPAGVAPLARIPSTNISMFFAYSSLLQ